jgi:phosphoribosyl 1,2-cyclic phosphodiesterase
MHKNAERNMNWGGEDAVSGIMPSSIRSDPGLHLDGRSRQAITVRFWGVRGSIACPEAATARYGGNTSCVEARCGKRLVIFDAGTGMRGLGAQLAQAGKSVDADIFFSHFHVDHVCGLPFFAPMYNSANRFRIWGGNLGPERGTAKAIGQFMSEPLFPMEPQSLKAAIQFRDFRAGETLNPCPGLTLRTGLLNHPGGATGYRLEYGRSVVAYITDAEHRPGVLDSNVLELAHRADLMIYDCNYTEEEYPAHMGWGHSTWQEGVRLAEAAGAKVLALFHHDPDRTDEQLDRIARDVRAKRPGTIVAAEGLTLRV